jgi:hypothetical protein
MTEEQARSPPKRSRSDGGIPFYVVRSAAGRVLPVQRPTDDCEILATIAPPSSGQAQTLV